jgi:very-short-patch-repair endonuclease
MPVKNIVIGQGVSNDMYLRAKELRRQMTPAEKVLWEKLRANRLSGLHFRRQQIIDRFLVDFYCHQHELIVEVDGDIHDLQKEYDLEREIYLIARGFRILRFRNEEVESNLQDVLKKILDTCKVT